MYGHLYFGLAVYVLLVCVCISVSTSIPFFDLLVVLAGVAYFLYTSSGGESTKEKQGDDDDDEEAAEDGKEAMSSFFKRHHELLQCLTGDEKLNSVITLAISGLIFLFFKEIIQPAFKGQAQKVVFSSLIGSWGELVSSCWALFIVKASRAVIKITAVLSLTSQDNQSGAQQWLRWGVLALVVVAVSVLMLNLIVMHEFRHLGGQHWERTVWGWACNWLFALLAMETLLCYGKFKLKRAAIRTMRFFSHQYNSREVILLMLFVLVYIFYDHLARIGSAGTDAPAPGQGQKAEV